MMANRLTFLATNALLTEYIVTEEYSLAPNLLTADTTM